MTSTGGKLTGWLPCVFQWLRKQTMYQYTNTSEANLVNSWPLRGGVYLDAPYKSLSLAFLYVWKFPRIVKNIFYCFIKDYRKPTWNSKRRYNTHRLNWTVFQQIPETEMGRNVDQSTMYHFISSSIHSMADLCICCFPRDISVISPTTLLTNFKKARKRTETVQSVKHVLDSHGKLEFESPTPIWNAKCGGIHLKSQYWGGRDPQIPVAYWSASLALLFLPS